MAVAKGLVAGLALGAAAVLLTKGVRHHVNHRDLDALARMALTPGWLQAIAVGVAVLLGPVTEEILFRGVLYGAYCKTMGSAMAAVLTTCLFLLLHFQVLIHSVPAFTGITALSMGALWCRLQSGAIGPAIAAHVGYNGLIAIAVFVFRGP